MWKCAATICYKSFSGNLSIFSERLWFTSFMNPWLSITAQKMKFSTKDFFSKCDQIRRKLRMWSQLMNDSLVENFIFVQWISADSEIKDVQQVTTVGNWNDQVDDILFLGEGYFSDISAYFLYVVNNFTKPVKKDS